MTTLRFVERYALPRAVLFAFFRRPGNVVAVAPPELSLRLVEGPDEVSVGDRFTVAVRRWGLTQQIVTEVTELEEPARIVEEQRQGPFRRWVLRREFVERGNETELVERIDYEHPGGLLGLTVTQAFVAGELTRAYAGRAERVGERLRSASA